MNADTDVVTPASRAFSLVVANVVVSLFAFFALYFIPNFLPVTISSLMRLTGVIAVSLIHYSIGVNRSIRNQEMNGVAVDSKEILSILYVLTAVNGALTTLLWWYGASDARPILLLFPSYLALSFSALHLIFRRVAYKRFQFADIMTIAAEGSGFKREG